MGVREHEVVGDHHAAPLLQLVACPAVDANDRCRDGREHRSVETGPGRHTGIGRRQPLEDLGERGVTDEATERRERAGRLRRDAVDGSGDRRAAHRTRRPSGCVGERRDEEPYPHQDPHDSRARAREPVGHRTSGGPRQGAPQDVPEEEPHGLARDGTEHQERECTEQPRARCRVPQLARDVVDEECADDHADPESDPGERPVYEALAPTPVRGARGHDHQERVDQVHRVPISRAASLGRDEQACRGEEAGVRHHPVVWTHGLSLDVPGPLEDLQ